MILLSQIPEPLSELIEPEPYSGCWLWAGGCDSSGYPSRRFGQRCIGVHRALYEMYVGGIEEGFHAHHKCRTSACVNPNHIELLASREHGGLRSVERTHCKHGHEYAVSGFWLGHKPKTTYRICKVCTRLAQGWHPDGGHACIRRTHCKYGHEFTPENTSWRGTGRVCRKCHVRRTLECRAAKVSSEPSSK